MRLRALLVCLTAACALAGCQDGRRALDETRLELERKAQVQLDSLDAQLATARARLRDLDTKTLARAETALAQIERRRSEARRELAEIRGLADGAWRRARAGMERTMAALDSLRERARELVPALESPADP